jgi:hypothetical protein
MAAHYGLKEVIDEATAATKAVAERDAIAARDAARDAARALHMTQELVDKANKAAEVCYNKAINENKHPKVAANLANTCKQKVLAQANSDINRAASAAYNQTYREVYDNEFPSAYINVLDDAGNQQALFNQFGFQIPNTDTSYDPIDVTTIPGIPVPPHAKPPKGYHKPGICENSTDALMYVVNYLLQNEKYLQAAEQILKCLNEREKLHHSYDVPRAARKQRIANRTAKKPVPGNSKQLKQQNKKAEKDDERHLKVREVMGQLLEIINAAGAENIADIEVQGTDLVVMVKPSVSIVKKNNGTEYPGLRLNWTAHYKPGNVISANVASAAPFYMKGAKRVVRRVKTRKAKKSKKNKTRKH